MTSPSKVSPSKNSQYSEAFCYNLSMEIPQKFKKIAGMLTVHLNREYPAIPAVVLSALSQSSA